MDAQKRYFSPNSNISFTVRNFRDKPNVAKVGHASWGVDLLELATKLSSLSLIEP